MTETSRIGWLSAGAPDPPARFLRALSELGWVEGQNLTFEQRYAEGRYERLPDLAAELVRLKVDLIVALGSAAPAAKQATTTIPIVMWSPADPIGSGLVQSLARPGGNVTGLTWDVTPEEGGKRMELLKQLVPKASRVAVLDVPLRPAEAPYVEAAEVAARALGMQLRRYEVRGDDGFEGAFAAMAEWRAQGLYVVDRNIFRSRHLSQIMALAARHRLPAVYELRLYVAAGGLMSYGKDKRDEPRRVATYVDKILRGAKPADLPVERPMKFELVVNVRTAKTLGLAIPQSVLVRVDELIE